MNDDVELELLELLGGHGLADDLIEQIRSAAQGVIRWPGDHAAHGERQLDVARDDPGR